MKQLDDLKTEILAYCGSDEALASKFEQFDFALTNLSAVSRFSVIPELARLYGYAAFLGYCDVSLRVDLSTHYEAFGILFMEYNQRINIFEPKHLYQRFEECRRAFQYLASPGKSFVENVESLPSKVDSRYLTESDRRLATLSLFIMEIGLCDDATLRIGRELFEKKGRYYSFMLRLAINGLEGWMTRILLSKTVKRESGKYSLTLTCDAEHEDRELPSMGFTHGRLKPQHEAHLLFLCADCDAGEMLCDSHSSMLTSGFTAHPIRFSKTCDHLIGDYRTCEMLAVSRVLF